MSNKLKQLPLVLLIYLLLILLPILFSLPVKMHADGPGAADPMEPTKEGWAGNHVTWERRAKEGATAEAAALPLPTRTPVNELATRLTVSRDKKAAVDLERETSPIMTTPTAEIRREAVLLTLRDEEQIEAARQYGREHFYDFRVFDADCKLPKDAFPVIQASSMLFVKADWEVIEFNQLPDCTPEQVCKLTWPYANNPYVFGNVADWDAILTAYNCETYEPDEPETVACGGF